MTNRWHLELPGDPPLTYTVLFSRTGAGDSTRLLLAVRDARFDLRSAQNTSGRDSTESVTDADSKERFARRLVLSGYEVVSACAKVKAPDACVVFTGSRGEVAAGLSAFAGEGAPALRARVAALVTPTFDRRLDVLASVFARSAEFYAYGDDFLRLVWPDRFPRARGKFEKARRTPGCAFDAGFGYPCTAVERARELTK